MAACLYLRGDKCGLWDDGWEKPDGCDEEGNCKYIYLYHTDIDCMDCSDFEEDFDYDDWEY